MALNSQLPVAGRRIVYLYRLEKLVAVALMLIINVSKINNPELFSRVQLKMWPHMDIEERTNMVGVLETYRHSDFTT